MRTVVIGLAPNFAGLDPIRALHLSAIDADDHENVDERCCRLGIHSTFISAGCRLGRDGCDVNCFGGFSREHGTLIQFDTSAIRPLCVTSPRSGQHELEQHSD